MPETGALPLRKSNLEAGRGLVLSFVSIVLIALAAAIALTIISVTNARAQALSPNPAARPLDIVREIVYDDQRHGQERSVRLLTGINLRRFGPDIYSPTDTVIDHILIDGPATVEGRWSCQYVLLGDFTLPAGASVEFVQKTSGELEAERGTAYEGCSTKYLLTVPAGSHDVAVPLKPISFGLWPLPLSRWLVTLGVPEIRHGVARISGSDAEDFIASAYRSYQGSRFYYWWTAAGKNGRFVVTFWETSGDGVSHKRTPFVADLTNRPAIAILAKGMLWPDENLTWRQTESCQTLVRVGKTGGQYFLRQGTCRAVLRLRQNAASLGQAVPAQKQAVSVLLNEVNNLEVFSAEDGFLTVRVLERNLVSFRPGIIVRSEFSFPQTEGLELTVNGKQTHYWNSTGVWRAGDGPAQTGPNSPFVNPAALNRLIIERDGKASYTEGGVE